MACPLTCPLMCDRFPEKRSPWLLCHQVDRLWVPSIGRHCSPLKHSMSLFHSQQVPHILHLPLPVLLCCACCSCYQNRSPTRFSVDLTKDAIDSTTSLSKSSALRNSIATGLLGICELRKLVVNYFRLSWYSVSSCSYSNAINCSPETSRLMRIFNAVISYS